MENNNIVQLYHRDGANAMGAKRRRLELSRV